MANEKILEKLESIFKEELWGRIEPKDIGISKFKILDDLFNTIVSEGLIQKTIDACNKQLEEHSDSISAMYLIGLIGYHEDKVEDFIMLRKLMDIFTSNNKWAIVEVLSEKILEYGESSIALRSLALSLERLGRSKEAIPVLENLLKIDRFDAEVSKKLSLAIIEDDPEKSILFMKLSIEGFIKNKEFSEVTGLWNKLVSISCEDFPFFERIERMLIDVRQVDLVINLLKILLNKLKEEEIYVDQTIDLLKQILSHKPDDVNARKDLIKYFGEKFEGHSQYKQFLKLSKLENFKEPVKFAIIDFEKNIVFDMDNYVHHNNWGLGKILEINNDNLLIDFKDKPGHKMSIKMALQSLAPIKQNHLYVIEYEDPESLKNIFNEDIMQFFELLVRSYGGKILLADIKLELIPKYVQTKDWAKWWNKVRTKIKKDPLFGVSEKRKDLFYIREKPITYADELLDNFIKTDSFSNKLDVAIEFNNNINKKEGSPVVQYLVDYFTDEAKGKSTTRQILSYLILKDLSEYVPPGKLKLDAIRTKVLNFIKESKDLHLLSLKISSYDYKKQLVNLIMEAREDWTLVISEFLFEVSVRIHKYIINLLIRAHAYNIINSFIDKIIINTKQYPEINIWISKNLLTRIWDYDWLDYSRKILVVNYFRLLHELKKIEVDGNRLKNISLDVLFQDDDVVLKDIVDEFDKPFLSKIYDLFNNITYVEDDQKNKFLDIIIKKFPDFQTSQVDAPDDWEPDIEKLIITREGYDKKKAELEKMVNVEIVTISKELSKVAELTGDMRENVEYNSLLEKQSILKLAISKLDDEMKKADIINYDNISTETVNIGTKVQLKDIKTGDINNFSILGPWDADFESGILSYRSPIARAILGKKNNEEVELKIDDEIKKFEIIQIDKYKV